MILPQVFETPAPASVAPAHRDDVTIAAACWALVQEISGDGVWNVEIWRHDGTGGFAGKPPCGVTVFGPWGETDSLGFYGDRHFDALTEAAAAVRARRAGSAGREKAFAALLDALGAAQCPCTAKQRAAGHKEGCWWPGVSAAIEAARKAVAS